MIRAAIICFVVGGYALFFRVSGQVEPGPFPSVKYQLCMLTIFLCIPTGLFLLFASGIRAVWRNYKHPDGHRNR
jgi:hypothetical protein